MAGGLGQRGGLGHLGMGHPSAHLAFSRRKLPLRADLVWGEDGGKPLASPRTPTTISTV